MQCAGLMKEDLRILSFSIGSAWLAMAFRKNLAPIFEHLTKLFLALAGQRQRGSPIACVNSAAVVLVPDKTWVVPE